MSKTMKLTVKAMGISKEIEVEKGSNYKKALKAFELLAERSLEGLKVYSGINELKDLEAPVQGGEVLNALKPKFASAGTIRITVKGMGRSVEVELDSNSNYKQLLKSFERLAEVSVDGLKVYAGINEVKDLDSTIDNVGTVNLLKPKFASAF